MTQPIVVIPTVGFFFDNSPGKNGKLKHDYYLDGKKLTGVTTILNVIAKPALIQWATDLAVGWLGWLDPRYNSPEDCMDAAIKALENIKAMDANMWLKALAEARVAHARRLVATADIGTRTHAWIEGYIKGQIAGQLTTAPDADIKGMCDQFVAWAKANVTQFLESERKVYSRTHWYAGTYDFLYLDTNRKKCIGDIKTANAIYDRTYFAQMAGYQICEEENGVIDIFGRTVVRCGKNGTFEARQSYDFITDSGMFLAALTIYRANESWS